MYGQEFLIPLRIRLKHIISKLFFYRNNVNCYLAFIIHNNSIKLHVKCVYSFRIVL